MTSPRAPRKIDPITAFVLGTHNFGLGNKEGEGRITVDDVIPVVRTATELNWLHRDGAILYRSAQLLREAMAALGQRPEEFPFSGKAGRWLVPALPEFVEHQPDALTQKIPFPWNQMTDRWGCSETEILAQAAMQMADYRTGKLYQLNIHDPPDKRAQAGLNWQADIVNGFNSAALKLRQGGFVEQIGLAIKRPSFAHEYLELCPGVIDVIGITSSPSISTEMLGLVKLAKKHGIKIKLMGILYGGAFACSQGVDPRKRGGFIYNYEAATPAEVALMGRYYDVCQKHHVSLLQLAWACAGSLMVAFPETVTQMVTTSLKPARLRETHEGVLNTYLPAACIQELKAAGLIDPDFPLE